MMRKLLMFFAAMSLLLGLVACRTTPVAGTPPPDPMAAPVIGTGADAPSRPEAPPSAPPAPEATAATEPAAPVPPPTPESIRRISVTDARTAVQKGTAMFVDVRGADQYSQGYIFGARHVPLEELANRMNELPKDKLIITYCS